MSVQTAEQIQVDQQTIPQEQPVNAPALQQSNVPTFAPEDVRNQMMAAMTPKSFDDFWRMATVIAESDLAPKDYRGKPGNVMLAWQTGVELGITSALQAIQNIAVINGRPAVWGDMMLAICRAAPSWSEEDFSEWIEGEGTQAVAYCQTRRKSGQLRVTSFSMQDAKVAGLIGKQGPWTNYPMRMLQMRARGYNLRDNFTPELKGIRMAEEERDVTPAASGNTNQPKADHQNGATGSKVSGKLAQRKQKAQQQKQAREVIEGQVEQQSEPEGPTFAQIAPSMHKAKSLQELDDVASLIGNHLPEDQVQELRGIYSQCKKALQPSK